MKVRTSNQCSKFCGFNSSTGKSRGDIRAGREYHKPLDFTSPTQDMPLDRDRYPANWTKIAVAVKELAGWKCSKCGQQCYRPGEKREELERSEWTGKTLCVHHSDYNPANNSSTNLTPLCNPCHLSLHAGRRGNISPGQLSLF